MLTSWVGTQCHRHVSLERRVVSTASSSVACQRNEGNAASSTRVRMFRTYRTYRTYRTCRMYGNKSPGPETQSNRSSGIGATENVQCVMCTCVRRPIPYRLYPNGRARPRLSPRVGMVTGEGPVVDDHSYIYSYVYVYTVRAASIGSEIREGSSSRANEDIGRFQGNSRKSLHL